MKPVLMVVSEVGYTWEEVIAPYREFEKKHLSIVIATPTGGIPKVDPLSIKIRPILSSFGLGVHPQLSPKTQIGKRLNKVLEKSKDLKKIEVEDYSGIYIAGGHGSLFDLNKNNALHKIILNFYNLGKPVGILCHASSTLVFIQEDGKPFIKDKLVTGFPTAWEYLILFTHQIYKEFLPLPIWTGRELDRYPSHRNIFTKVSEVLNPYYVIEDKNLISGVGPKTGGIIARKIIKSLR